MTKTTQTKATAAQIKHFCYRIDTVAEERKDDLRKLAPNNTFISEEDTILWLSLGKAKPVRELLEVFRKCYSMNDFVRKAFVVKGETQFYKAVSEYKKSLEKERENITCRAQYHKDYIIATNAPALELLETLKTFSSEKFGRIVKRSANACDEMFKKLGL